MITVQNLDSEDSERTADEKQRRPAIESRPFLSRGEMISTALGIGVLIVSVLAWWAVYRQTNIMERSLRLQESALRQWLNTDEWNIEMGEGNDITIFFSVLNNTDFPLWLETVNVTVPNFEQAQAVGTWMIPKGKYSITAPVRISEERMTAFQSGRLILPVELSMFFRDTLKNRWEQKSELTVVKYMGGIDITESRQIIFDSPAEDKKKGRKNPKPQS